MAWAMWTLFLIYGASIALLILGRIASRRVSGVRRFLIGEQAEDGWQRRAETGWRRGG